MSTQSSKELLSTVPIIVAVLVLPEASGVAQTIAAVIAVIATTGLVSLGARFIWTPIVKKAGFWSSSLLLGCAVVLVGLAVSIAGSKLGAGSYARRLSLYSGEVGMLFSWSLAAVGGAQEKQDRSSQQSQRPPSVLFRPSSPRSRFRPRSR